LVARSVVRFERQLLEFVMTETRPEAESAVAAIVEDFRDRHAESQRANSQRTRSERIDIVPS